MNTNDKVYVAGHRGMVGSAIVRALKAQGFWNIVTVTRQSCDLRRQDHVQTLFRTEKPDYVFLCAAKVGGIVAHLESPVDFLLDNLAIQGNVMQAAHKYGVKKLLFLGSACAYPKHAPNPIKEEYLLSGPLESSNRGYALAKIAGIEMCKSYRKQYGDVFISCMPTNLYGPGDTYHTKNSHVVPGMMKKIYLAMASNSPRVTLWGTGTPVREFLYSEDLAGACLFLMDNYSGDELVNVGSGEAFKLSEVAKLIAFIIGFKGVFEWDTSKPDGTPERFLDNSKLRNLEWKPRTDFMTGLRRAYDDFLCYARL